MILADILFIPPCKFMEEGSTEWWMNLCFLYSVGHALAPYLVSAVIATGAYLGLRKTKRATQ